MEEIAKETFLNDDIRTFVQSMKINRMYELPDNNSFKWAMIEHNDYGYCWTMGYRGLCTTIFSTDNRNDIKYWISEAEVKNNLITKICCPESMETNF